MKKIIAMLLAILILPSIVLAAEVKNLKVGQEGDKAVATYDLVATTGEQEVEVTVAINVNGQRRTSERLTLTGDYGKKVNVGSGKRIVWNAMTDLPPGFDGELTWDVQAVSSEVPFVGTWVSESDRAILILTKSTFYLKFPYQDGTRENYGEIISYDIKSGHITLKYYQILQDGKEIQPDDKIKYMTYEIYGNILQKNMDNDNFPKEVQNERYIAK